jgi:hypothetical protein
MATQMKFGVCSLAAFFFFLGLQSAARADTAYMITGSRDFGTINLNTGVYTSTGPTSTGSGPQALSGLGEIGSTLYAESFGSGVGTLYTINTATGALTAVGTDNTFNPIGFGSTLTGLYGLEENNLGKFDLFSINSATAMATDLGPTGLALGGDYTLSTNSGILYFALGADSSNGFASELYTLSTINGAATLVGPTGGPQFGGLVTEGSVLYGGAFNTKQVDTLNTGTGAAAAGPGLTGTTSDFSGLAAIPATTATPEPRSVSLLLFGLLAVGGWVRARLSKQDFRSRSCTSMSGSPKRQRGGSLAEPNLRNRVLN